MAWAKLTRAWNETRLSGWRRLIDLPQAVRYNLLLESQRGVKQLAQGYSDTDLQRRDFSRYYFSQALLLTGQFDAFRKAIRACLYHRPNDVDAAFLYSQLTAFDAEFTTEDADLLWRILEHQAGNTSRRKIWLAMSYLVQDQAGLDRMSAALAHALSVGARPRYHFQVNEHWAVAALRAGHYKQAKELWRENLAHSVPVAGSKPSTKPASRSRYDASTALSALRDVTHLLEKLSAQPFLVSGTLLGMVRNGSLLPHDKDVDIGIWEDVPRSDLLVALQQSGSFWVQPARSQDTIRVKHINGTPIDIFYHYREGNSVWHGGVKAQWWNSDFSIEQRRFSSGLFNVPRDTERYLSENYGDWRVPVVIFDSVYDTPNATIVNEDEMIIHDYRSACESLRGGRQEKARRYLSSLREKGEPSGLLDRAFAAVG